MRIIITGSLANIVGPIERLAQGNLRPLREGLYEGGGKVRTRVRRALWAQTGVKAYRDITQRVPSVGAGLSYIIKGLGKGLPIDRFPVSAPGSVTASPWGGVGVGVVTGAAPSRRRSRRRPSRG